MWKYWFGTLVSLRFRICDQEIFHSNYRFHSFRIDLTYFFTFFRLGETEGSMPVTWTTLNPTTLVTQMKRFNFPELEIFDEWMKSVSVNFFVKLFIMPHRAFFNGFFYHFKPWNWVELKLMKIDLIHGWSFCCHQKINAAAMRMKPLFQETCATYGQ